ncbi:ABC transporter permease, partial [Herbaspirillum sp. HC18]
MATLELSVQDDVTATPVRGKRKLGLLFWLACAWLAII